MLNRADITINSNGKKDDGMNDCEGLMWEKTFLTGFLKFLSEELQGSSRWIGVDEPMRQFFIFFS